MDKFELIDAIVKRVDALADARGAQKCAIVIEMIQQLGALRKGMADDDAAQVGWFDVRLAEGADATVALPEGGRLAFDHAQIIADAAAMLL